MGALVPSYIAKVARAKKHLIDLEGAVKVYAASKPYLVSEGVEGKKKPRVVRRLVFTADPANTDIPIIAADVIYNLRSALEHLMCALVARKARYSAEFPIYFYGVWEDGVQGEDQQRAKDRRRWASNVKTLSDEAVAILKRLQPPDDGRDDTDADLLKLINGLSNCDRHRELPIFAAGLLEMTARFKAADGSPKVHRGDILPGFVLQDKTEIADIPEDAMDVEIEGVPLVAISVADEGRYVPLPAKLDAAARFIEESVIPSLMPYVRAK